MADGSRQEMLEYDGYFPGDEDDRQYSFLVMQGEKQICRIDTWNQRFAERDPLIYAEGIKWTYTFFESSFPTVFPGVRGYFVDLASEEKLGSIAYGRIFADPEEDAMDSPDGPIRILTYPDGAFQFLLDDEPVAAVERKEDPVKTFSVERGEYPAEFHISCSAKLSEVTRRMILCVPFLGLYGKNPAHRLNKKRDGPSLQFGLDFGKPGW